MQCESCHQREATCHLTIILGDAMQKRDLCEECFEASSHSAKQFTEEAREARCEYCGEQPCATGIDILALGTGIQEMKSMCMSCSAEYLSNIQKELDHLPAELSQEEQMEQIRELSKRLDAYMRHWASRNR